jgi:hypothetical protein
MCRGLPNAYLTPRWCVATACALGYISELHQGAKAIFNGTVAPRCATTEALLPPPRCAHNG